MDSTNAKIINRGRVMLILSICCAAYWITGNSIDVYKIVVVGVVYEILWLPMILLLFGMPVLAIIFWIRERFSFQSVYPFIILIFAIIFLILKFAI